MKTLSSEIMRFVVVCRWSNVSFILPIALEDVSSTLCRIIGQQTPQKKEVLKYAA
jgi:hypothetical protein